VISNDAYTKPFLGVDVMARQMEQKPENEQLSKEQIGIEVGDAYRDLGTCIPDQSFLVAMYMLENNLRWAD
jgi:hypothetical protein